MSRLLAFDELRNIRDLGGDLTADGRRISEGKLIRCGHLAKLSEEDQTKLAALTDTVVDFRTDAEREENADIILPGVRYLHMPVVSSLTAGITREAESDKAVFESLMLRPREAHEYMCSMYRIFAQSESAAAQYGAFVRVLLEPHPRAVLWHCTAGKDRAGMASVIVAELLGVPRDRIIEDYLSTNIYLEADIRFLTKMIKEQTGTTDSAADEALRYMFGAERAFIDSWYTAITEQYGSVETYAREALRISAEDEAALRDLYLE